MKVLMISGDHHVIQGNSGPFALTLKELSKVWTQIDVLCPGQNGKKRHFLDNVNLLGVRKWFLFLDVIKQLRTTKYDLVVSHDYGLMLNGLSARVALLFFKIPHISEIHHLEGFPIATDLKELFYRWWGKLYLFIFARSFFAIRLVNQGSVYQYLKQIHYPESRILILHAINLDLELLKPLGLPKPIHVLFVGRLVENKGLFTLLKAIQRCHQKNLFLNLVLKGRGPLLNKVEEWISANNLKNYVTINTEIVTEAQMVEIYNQAQVLVCASTVEGGPRVTFEAMACQVPVITTPCGLMPEIIEHERNGFLFDGTPEHLSDLLLDFFKKHIHSQTLKNNSRNSAERFDYKICLSNYAHTYKNIIPSTFNS